MSTPSASNLRRGEVHWLDFAPATGQEMTGMHPCVVVQNDVGNRHSALIIVVAVTGNLRVASLPVGVLLRAGEAGLSRDCVAHCGHVYTVDKRRYTVDKRRLVQRIGVLSPARMAEVNAALARSVGLAAP